MSNFSFTLLALRRLNVVPFILTVAILGGILAHDTLVDKAAAAALAVPVAALATYGTLSVGFGTSDQQHDHTERGSIGQTLREFTSAQPLTARYDRGDAGRKKKRDAHQEGSEYHWPSV